MIKEFCHLGKSEKICHLEKPERDKNEEIEGDCSLSEGEGTQTGVPAFVGHFVCTFWTQYFEQN